MSTRYIYGYKDGTFRPERKIRRKEIVAMVGRALEVPGGYHGENEFKDLWNRKSYYIGYVNNLAQIGIIKGYKDGTFRPHKKLTRIEFAYLIVQIEDRCKEKGENLYLDEQIKIKIEEYRRKNKVKAVTRREAIEVLNRLLNRRGQIEWKEEKKFRDIGTESPSIQDILVAANEVKSPF